MKVLVVGYAAIGDLLFFLPVVQELRKRFPEARITWLANDYPTTRELLPATGLIDEFWMHDWEGPRARAESAGINKKIAGAGFDWAVLTQAAPAHYYFKGLKSVPNVIGHARKFESAPLKEKIKRFLVTGELQRRLLVNKRVWCSVEPEHSVKRNLRLLEAAGLSGPFDDKVRIPLPPEAVAQAERLLPGGPWIAVHVAAARNQYGKIWPAEKFGRACAELARTSKARFALLASSEAGTAEAVDAAKREFPSFVDLSGRLSLLETFAVIARCGLFFGCDGGPAKAAMALGVPTASVFGPGDPREVGVYWEPEKHLEIRTGIACSPCARLGMPLLDRLNYTTCGHRDCIGKLDVGFVIKALRDKYDLFR